MTKLNTYIIIATSVFALCATAPVIAAAGVKQNTSAAPTKTKLKHKEILTHLLKAEMALQRNMYEVALQNYLIVARASNDPEVAQLATEIALELQDKNAALEAADIWATNSPENLQAQLVGITLYASDDSDKTVKYIENALRHHPEGLEQHLTSVLEELPPRGKGHLTNTIFLVAEQNPDNAYAQLCAAQIAAVQADITKAKEKLNRTLKIAPGMTGAIQLQAKIIRHESESDLPALSYLEKSVQEHSKNTSLRMFYAKALMDNNETKKALPHFKILSSDSELGGEALILMGEINIDDDKHEIAEENIRAALKYDSTADKARYYLAQLFEYENKNDEAIEWYEQVESASEYHTPAYLRAAYLYSVEGNYTSALNTLQSSSPTTFDDQKQILLTEVDILIDAEDLEQALESANRVIVVLPNDTDFLYARSVVLTMLDKYTQAERDLREILSSQPTNANALNALGFILTVQPDRINEALPFIQQAMDLNPNNPAFMDSMGWYLYKTGYFNESIVILEKAYKLSGDNEVAAHLGEVLWTTGHKTRAKEIWRQALQSSENKGIIQETLTRLNIPEADLNINGQ